MWGYLRPSIFKNVLIAPLKAMIFEKSPLLYKQKCYPIETIVAVRSCAGAKRGSPFCLLRWQGGDEKIGRVTAPVASRIPNFSPVRVEGEAAEFTSKERRVDTSQLLKGQCHEIFDLWFFSSNNPP
jgi:hypothetical protein